MPDEVIPSAPTEMKGGTSKTWADVKATGVKWPLRSLVVVGRQDRCRCGSAVPSEGLNLPSQGSAHTLCNYEVLFSYLTFTCHYYCLRSTSHAERTAAADDSKVEGEVQRDEDDDVVQVMTISNCTPLSLYPVHAGKSKGTIGLASALFNISDKHGAMIRVVGSSSSSSMLE